MALFKILKGKAENLPSEYHAGYMYITEDTGLIYLDTTDTAGGRICLNSEAATKLRKIVYDDNGEIQEVVNIAYDDIKSL